MAWSDGNDPSDGLTTAAIWFLVILAVMVTVEAGFLVHGYLTADVVQCSFWRCEFTKTSTSIVRNVTSECYANGARVDCAELATLYPSAPPRPGG